MMESYAFGALSLGGHRILACLEVELAHHAGTDNGNLISTYSNFTHFGVDREAVAPSLREVVALGFLEIMKQGRGGNAEHREATRYRLTYKHTDRENPTDEWRHIAKECKDRATGLKAAKAIATNARNAKDPAVVARSNKHAKKQDTAPESPQPPPRNLRPETEDAPPRKSRRTAPGGSSRPTIYISGEDTAQSPREARPSKGAVASGVTERDRTLRAAIASRLGPFGESILGHLDSEHIENLMALQERGELREDVLVNLRHHHRNEAAA